MKTIRLIMLLMTALLAGVVSAAGVKNLKGKKLDFVCADAQFKNPFIDVDKTMHVSIDVPQGTGKVVRAAWCMDGSGEFTQPVDLSKAQFSANGEHVEFDTTVSYNQPGTYFPTVKVFSERKGDVQTPYTCIPNLGKVRIVVK